MVPSLADGAPIVRTSSCLVTSHTVSPAGNAAFTKERDKASEHLLRYINRLIRIKSKRPGADLISSLLQGGLPTPRNFPVPRCRC